MTGLPGELRVWAPDGVGEIKPGDDLAAAFLAVAADRLRDGDIVTVTSKVVSKAEGRIRYGDRTAAIEEETRRVVARRGDTVIVRNRLGLTMAAAGVDASNVDPGAVLLLPVDPDVSARALRTAIDAATGHNVAVLVTDTAGRTWRQGQTDLAIGAAGLRVADDHAGQVDGYGNTLAVTLPAVADELASAAELTQHKLGGRPFAVIGGRPDLVLPAGDDGPGAVDLIRPEGADLFGYGAREAVLQAVAQTAAQAPGGDAGTEAMLPFGAPADARELADAVHDALGATGVVTTYDSDGLRLTGPETALALAAAVAYAHGWVVLPQGVAGTLRLQPGSSSTDASQRARAIRPH